MNTRKLERCLLAPHSGGLVAFHLAPPRFRLARFTHWQDALDFCEANDLLVLNASSAGFEAQKERVSESGERTAHERKEGHNE